MTEELRAQLMGVKLTKKEKLIAEFILDNFAESCFITSTDIAKRLHVSDSSVIRFTRTLGYSGFMDFQKSIRKTYTERINSVSDNITVPSERLKLSISKLGQSDIVESYFSNVLQNLKYSINHNDTLAFERAAGLIAGSKRKFIVTSRANTCIGDMMLLLLKHLLTDVYETSHPALNVIDHICDITENDCIIAVSFPRYSEMDLLAAQMAYDAGAKIILITDKASSPLAQYATQLLTVSVDSNTFFNSYVGVLFTMELLCSFISRKMGYSTEAKLQLIDKYISKVGLF
ncbi:MULTISPECIES: MurR/RpiR family transcriptional regulator [Anaerotignum]|uniref:HTH-type transcriptional regulator MurR n=1 Tax=Anaerotignum propionicum DSM 1682 TaxID=991789 RepID=A0A0X8V8K1_ANAPI|nr:MULTISPECIES: MurR/RpiR family transcriptional regulator [Anaerotignum]AMJ40057.1 HTH-type transcriptional regulator MurR [Anaerotignum propionicum DSM 1682]MEA5058100.1 MurR/RpiR family transcriptional regulator [Anaerotignum propionicum]SHE79613.1 transcriptional regulator, RpiR family [[Clostridium] propionicum DSM 1682] [Anaerotignum propionicum DSM 1682]